jgi:hypothetical protein
MPPDNAHDDTGIRSVSASLILRTEGSLIVRRVEDSYQLTGMSERKQVTCDTWAAAERVLLRLGVPFHKVDEIASLLDMDTDVVVHRELKI